MFQDTSPRADAAATASKLDILNALLAKTEILLETTPDKGVIDELAAGLADLHDRAVADGDLAELKSAVQAHPLHSVILADPYSRRAFDKPRGYAGDAVMLDYIYRPQDAGTGDAGRAVHHGTTQLATAQSVLWRREYLADLILRTMANKPHVSMLSVACGHMRELDLVRDKTKRRDLAVTALDQDAASIDECLKSYGSDFAIWPVAKSLTHIIKGGFGEQTFDLIYSAGLFDYLSDRVAVALIRALYKHLRPGAVLSVGNFVPDNHGRGFMEFLMDWSLVKRTEDDMRRLAAEACPEGRVRTFLDEPKNVAYIEITKP